MFLLATLTASFSPPPGTSSTTEPLFSDPCLPFTKSSLVSDPHSKLTKLKTLKLSNERFLSRISRLILLDNFTKFAVNSKDSEIIIWDFLKSKPIRHLSGHSKRITNFLSLCNGNLVTFSYDRTIKLWNIHNGKCLKTLTGPDGLITTLVEDKGFLISGGSDGQINIWDLGKDGGERVVRRIQENKQLFCSALIVLEDARIACGSEKNINIYDYRGRSGQKTLTGHKDLVTKLVGLKRNVLVSVSLDKTLRAWNWGTEECLGRFEGHKQHIVQVFRCNSEGMFASVGCDDRIYFWDLEKKECLRVVEGDLKAPSDIVVTQDGVMACCNANMTIAFWGIQPAKR